MVERYGVYRDYEYYVVFMKKGGWRSGYIGIPKGHPYYGRFYDEIPYIDCHKGLTFSDFLPELDIAEKNIWYLGFDYNHYADGYDWELLKKYNGAAFVEERLNELDDRLMTRKINTCVTTDEVEEECKHVIDQIIANTQK